MHTLAEALRRQFNQEAVLTFDYLPQNAPGANSIAVTVPNIDIARFRDAFAATIAYGRLEFATSLASSVKLGSRADSSVKLGSR